MGNKTSEWIRIRARLAFLTAAASITLAPMLSFAQEARSPEDRVPGPPVHPMSNPRLDCRGIPNGPNQVTNCGCGIPADSCLDCTGTPYGKRQPTGPRGGVPSLGDPCVLECATGAFLLPSQNRCITCQGIGAQIINVGLVSYHPNKEPNTNETRAVVKRGIGAFTTFAGVNSHSSCIGNVLKQCTPIGQTVGYMLIARRTAGNNADADRCVGNWVRRWGVVQNQNAKNLSIFGVPTDRNVGYAFVTRNGASLGQCGPAPQELVDLALANQCPVIEMNVVEYHSPVSLLWTDDVAIDTVTSFTAFPVDGKSFEENKVFEWKGSSMTPLVVHDPSGRGQIKDASQLFGNYSFGKEWKDGYAALASLDKDSSGWLEGDELTGVALWFDLNQDGVSQRGEVKKLADTGVHAIGVRGDSVDEKTKSIFASQGFKRTVDGKEYVGRSVDWFGGRINDSLPKVNLSDGLSENNETKPSGPIDPGSDTEKIDMRTTVNGVWEWRMTDDKMLLPEQQPGGLLAFTQEGSAIRGQSVSTKSLLPNIYKVDEIISSFPLLGTFTGGDVSFEVKGDTKPRASSTAKLSPDGMRLIGSTTEEVPIEGGTAQVTFSWEAKRLINPD